MKNADRYSDIINLPHHQSATRPRMSNYDRAAQFSPFAALKGYDEEIKETQRTIEAKKELTDEQITELNEKLVILKQREKDYPAIKITYFIPGEKKTGGNYLTREVRLKKADEHNKKLLLLDGEIEFENIYSIEIL